jgi:hypothetical protein
LIILKRGRVVLTQIKITRFKRIFTIKDIVENIKKLHPPKKINVINVEIKIILAYSAKKKSAKLIAEYSTL